MFYKSKPIQLMLFINLLFGQSASSVLPLFQELLIEYPNVRDFSISADEDEAYLSVQSPRGDISSILVLKKTRKNWGKPRIASFSGGYMDLEPFLSPDGLKLYFASNRPLESTEEKAKDYDLWFVQRSSKIAAWSAPSPMDTIINSEHNEFFPSLTRTGNLYFTSDKPDSKGKDDIFYSELKEGQYLEPVSLSDSVNSAGYEFNAFIAPDESYLLFSGYNRPDGLGSGDLYVSYRNADGNWSAARNLGEQINSKYMDYCPFVTAKTNTLFFTSRRSNINQSPMGFKSIKELSREINKYENGYSRVYQVSADGILR
ncbi:PD40 domain-containing protein [bacterium]|nr:PD40 domain-containing protein [bacterium]